jgi:hypothetical protein
MSRARLAGVFVIAAAVAAAVLWRLETTKAVPEANASTVSAAVQAQAGQVSPAQSADLPPQSPQPTAPPEQSLEQAFHDADDLLAFVDSMRPAAQAGDGASAWWIYRALRRCDSEYRSYFQRGGHILTLDEALQINAGNRFLSMDETRKLHVQCARLREAEFGGRETWVLWLHAASAEIPIARIELARALVIEAEKNGGRATAREAAQRLATEALQSKDPAVVAGMGELATLASGFGGSPAQFDWLVAGCQRGLDCSPQSEFVTQWCRGDPNCQPFEDVEAILRRISPAQYDDIERRAREINRRIDEGRFEELVNSVLPNE